VRQVSFRYFEDGPQQFLADHDTLALRLSMQKGAKGVILDVRENGGGNDPNSFVDWWAPARRYTDTFTVMRKTSLVADRDALEKLVINTPKAVKDFYVKCMQDTSNAQFCARRPFACKADTCDWNNEFLPAHQVTKLPVALLTGPGCGSACDAFVYTWKKNAFGPLVGTPTMAGFTTNRYRAQVPARVQFGTFDLAFSYDVSADGDMVEGHLITPDVPVAQTWENHASYDTLLVDAAIKALGDARWKSR
jgi:C-terminal processing protease CtpA/Prc